MTARLETLPLPLSLPRRPAADDGAPPRTAARLEVPRALVARCREGDEAAFEELFVRCRDHVYTLALHLAGDEAVAADLTQEVFLKLLGRIGQFRAEAEFPTWLYRIVMNAFLDHRRSRRPWLPLFSTEEETDERPELVLEATQEEEVLAREDARRVRRALARLDEHWRAPLVLRYSAGLSYDEIGAVLGVSPGTVASRLNRAHLRLAKKLRAL